MVGRSGNFVRTGRREATRKSLKEEFLPLFDFWYFWSRKSTIKEKFPYASSRANNVRPYHAGRRWRRPLQDKNPSKANNQNKKYKLHSVSARTPSTPANALSAGVQTMRARICSAFSCAMFARVVWLKSRRARDYRLAPLALCRTHSPRMARATNSCTPRWFARRTARVLLADFCRAFRQ